MFVLELLLTCRPLANTRLFVLKILPLLLAELSEKSLGSNNYLHSSEFPELQNVSIDIISFEPYQNLCSRQGKSYHQPCRREGLTLRDAHQMTSKIGIEAMTKLVPQKSTRFSILSIG